MIYGLDLSLTATGIASLTQPGKVALSTVGSDKHAKPETRLFDLARDIELRLSNPQLIVMEGLSYGSNDPSAQERAALHWMIRIALHMRSVPYLVIPPSTLKKFTCGAGNAKKEMMIREVYRQWKVEAADNNQADAAALAYMGAAIRRIYTPTNQPQREVISRLMAPPVGKSKRGKKA